MTNGDGGWKKFGWREFSLDVPDDWELGGLGKDDDDKSGYLRLDDRHEVRMELKWSYVEGEPDLDAVREEFLKHMQESADKHGAHLQIRKYARSEKLVPRGPGRTVFPFHWSGGVDADGVALYCSHCDRMTVIQILTSPKRRNEEQLERIFASFEDHRNEKALWSVHGLRALVPVELSLESQELKTGYIGLTFKDELERPVKVERYGLAEFILADQENLEEWLLEEYSREFLRADMETRTTTIKGHEGLVVHATMPGALGRVVRRARQRLNKKAITWKHWRLWHCRPSNAIYVVYQGNQSEDDELLPQLAADLECHREEKELKNGSVRELPSGDTSRDSRDAEIGAGVTDETHSR